MVPLLWTLIQSLLADRLFDQKEFYHAATEYERLLFEIEDGEPTGYLIYRLALSYAGYGELERAEAILRGLCQDSLWGYEAQIALSRIYQREGRYAEARWELEELLASHPRKEVELFQELGMIELRAGDPARAARYFLSAGDSALARKADELSNLPRRDPKTALLLSTILPGAGEIYSGRYREGLSAFLVNLISLGGVAVSLKTGRPVDALLIGLIFFNRFYQGSRYNAYNFASEFNRRVYQQSLHQLGLNTLP